MSIPFRKSDLYSAFPLSADGNSSPSPLSPKPFISALRRHLLIETHPDHTSKLQPSLLINLTLLCNFSFSLHIAYITLKHTSNSLISTIIVFLPSTKTRVFALVTSVSQLCLLCSLVYLVCMCT